MMAVSKKKAVSRIAVLLDIFRKPGYWAIFLISGILYYFVFYLIAKANAGIFLVTVPMYLVLVLVASAALTLVVSIYGLFGAYRQMKKATCTISASASALIPAIGGIAASCGCESGLLMPFLLSLGFDAVQAFSFSRALAAYNMLVFAILIAINLFLVYFQLGKERGFHEEPKNA